MLYLQLPIILSVAPNGSRKTKEDHPNLPLSPEELAREAALCKEKGATLFHIHIRDKNGNHSLEPHSYRNAIKAIRQEVGDQMIIQITTDACGIFNLEQQIDTVKKVKPESASIAIAEFFPDDKAEKESAEFLAWLTKEQIIPQYIIYSQDELKHFSALRQRGIIPGDHVFLLFVLGRYVKGQHSTPHDLIPFLATLHEKQAADNILWGACAFGKEELACVTTAAALGGHARIGFENNTHLIDGSIAQNNAELLQQFNQYLIPSGRKLATIEMTRKLLGYK